MREILFRGKDIDTGNWVEGWYLRHPFSRWPLKDVITPAEEAENGHHHYVEVDSDTIGQYTGLKDKNGQRIFEGDLVQTVLPPSISQPSFVWPIMPVVFSDGVFGLQDQRGGVTPFKSFAPRVTFEVKGNIHDNPELLKEDSTC